MYNGLNVAINLKAYTNEMQKSKNKKIKYYIFAELIFIVLSVCRVCVFQYSIMYITRKRNQIVDKALDKTNGQWNTDHLVKFLLSLFMI